MYDNEKLKRLCLLATETFTTDSQMDVVIEECGELIQAIIKLRRNKDAKSLIHLKEEMADVFIMLHQLIVCCGSIDKEIDMTLEKIEKMLNKTIKEREKHEFRRNKRVFNEDVLFRQT